MRKVFGLQRVFFNGASFRPDCRRVVPPGGHSAAAIERGDPRRAEDTSPLLRYEQESIKER